ncbi:MAG: DEAD/DEAH box helicase [Hungatella sp.]|nr:DEAD/DEAH box helicase [Hungatella sp.]
MIGEFRQIADNYGVPEEILEKIEYEISGGGTRPVGLTALQREAIGNDRFWCSNDRGGNVIVQGATSSGKTLVAELLTLQCVFAMNKHVIYLVPLKALVSEKVQQFKRDIFHGERTMGINIFASSSDYQDHDTELAEGQYDIAVVVYEKFFAMLAEQKDNKFLEKCGLIVVDEIQLLSSQDRGAKLEYSLTKVRNNYQNTIRILGLTTVDCDTSYVNRWLEAEIIKNSQRPIGLKERIISLSGLFWERYIKGEGEAEDSEPEEGHIEGRIQIEDTEKLKNKSVNIKKQALLRALLRKISNEDDQKKIIVFANSRERCKSIAGEIAKGGVFSRQEVNASLSSELEKTDDDSEKNLLQNELLPYGIAYHSAALPMSLRELIEQEFKRADGSIRLIVATETITIGMNLPADVMILYDKKVFRGSDGGVDIRPQEYKNYIGRAGRLGITDKIGESYLFVDTDSDIPYYWKQYVNCRIEEVSSALRDASSRESAPYYLNLLCKGKEEVFSEQTIKKLSKKTLNAAEASWEGREYDRVDTAKIIEDFKKVGLIRHKDTESSELDDDMDSAYKLTNFGEMLAPYALSVVTCFNIKKYFRDGGSAHKAGLPIDYTSEDLKKDRYLLDILFTVCKMHEVKKIIHPGLPEPKNPNSRRIYQKMEEAVLNYLNQYKEREGEDGFWDNSEIERVFFSDEEPETEQLTAALRAILLFHWIKGELPSQIKEHAGLKIKEFTLYTGDMSRIGESCSYILEAISKCLFTNKKRIDGGGLEHGFYSLAVKLKYGLSNPNLIQVANRHVYGLSRSTIIQMDKAAQGCGFDNINLFIRSSNKKVFDYLTPAQRRDLIQQMSERYDDRNVENLIAKLVEDEIVDFSMESHFKAIAHPREAEEWLDSIRNVFSFLDGVRQLPLAKNHSSARGIRLKWKDHEMYMVLLFDKASVSKEKLAEYRKQLNLQAQDKVLFVHGRDADLDLSNPNDITISADYMSKVILEFLALSGCINGVSICNYLYEQEGAVSDKGMSSLQKSIEKLLEYSEEESCGDEEALSSYKKYIRKYGYKDLEVMDSPHGHAIMHMVQGSRGIGNLVIKEIRIPENEEEFEALDAKAKELWERYGQEADEEELETMVRQLCCCDIPPADLKDIIAMSRKREGQLYGAVEHKKAYFYQSLVFLTEGYKRLNEVRIAAALASSHIVMVFNPEIFHVNYEHGSLNSVDTKFNHLRTDLFFAMQSYDGSLLDKREELNNNREEIIRIGIQISEALKVCHENKILHRDIKPANILFLNKSEYYLCDFGSAVKINAGKTYRVGTRGFIAPEADAGEYSERSDIYSLGKTLLFLYKGREQASGEQSPEEDELMLVLKKACEEKPSARYEGAGQLRDALRTLKLPAAAGSRDR